jgi:hypothetical protein
MSDLAFSSWSAVFASLLLARAFLRLAVFLALVREAGPHVCPVTTGGEMRSNASATANMRGMAGLLEPGRNYFLDRQVAQQENSRHGFHFPYR